MRSKINTFIALILLALCGQAQGQTVPILKFKTSIPTPTSTNTFLSSLAQCPSTLFEVSSSFTGSSLTTIDPVSLTATNTVSIPLLASGIVISPDCTTAVVMAIDTQSEGLNGSLTVVAPGQAAVTVPLTPTQIIGPNSGVFTPDGKSLYLAGGAGGTTAGFKNFAQFDTTMWQVANNSSLFSGQTISSLVMAPNGKMYGTLGDSATGTLIGLGTDGNISSYQIPTPGLTPTDLYMNPSGVLYINGHVPLTPAQLAASIYVYISELDTLNTTTDVATPSGSTIIVWTNLSWPSAQDSNYAYSAFLGDPLGMNLAQFSPAVNRDSESGNPVSSLTSTRQPDPTSPTGYTDFVFAARNGEVDVYSVAPPPQLYAVVGAGNFAPGPVASGEMVAVFTGLATNAQPESAGVLPLPTALAGGTQVLINGAAVPLQYASASQINAEMPTFPSGSTTATMSVVGPNGTTNKITVAVAPTAPQLYGWHWPPDNPQELLATDANGNSSTFQALAGNLGKLYGTGFGITNPQVTNGKASPFVPKAVIMDQPQFIICGVQIASSQISFAGLTPGFAGRYEFDVMFPNACADAGLNVKQRSLISPN